MTEQKAERGECVTVLVAGFDVVGGGAWGLCQGVTLGRVSLDYSEMNLLFYICFGNTNGRLGLLFL